VSLRDSHQAERIIEFAIGQQAGIGGHIETVELQLESAVEIKAQRIGFGFTRQMLHLRPRSNETRRCVLWLKWIRRRPVQWFIWEMRE